MTWAARRLEETVRPGPVNPDPDQMEKEMETRIIVALAAASAAATAHAQIAEYLDVPLDGPRVVLPADPMPPSGSGSPSTGVADFTVDLDAATFSFDLDVTGISVADFDNTHGGNDSAIHVHVGDEFSRGAIIVDVQWYAMTQPGGLLEDTADGFRMHAEGEITALQGMHDTGFSVAEILGFVGSDTTYITVHDLTYPTGAIRGNFIPAPSAAAVLGLGGLMMTRRRR